MSVARVWCGTVVLGCMHGCNGVRRVAMGSWLGVGAEIRQRVWRGSGGAGVGCSGGVGLSRVKRVRNREAAALRRRAVVPRHGAIH